MRACDSSVRFLTPQHLKHTRQDEGVDHEQSDDGKVMVVDVVVKECGIEQRALAKARKAASGLDTLDVLYEAYSQVFKAHRVEPVHSDLISVLLAARLPGNRSLTSRSSTFPNRDLRDTPIKIGNANACNSAISCISCKLCCTVFAKPHPGSTNNRSRAIPACSQAATTLAL